VQDDTMEGIVRLRSGGREGGREVRLTGAVARMGRYRSVENRTVFSDWLVQVFL